MKGETILGVISAFVGSTILIDVFFIMPAIPSVKMFSFVIGLWLIFHGILNINRGVNND